MLQLFVLGAQGGTHVDVLVEAAGTCESGIERVRSVGGSNDYNAFGGRKAIHFGKELIYRLTTGIRVSGIALGANLPTNVRKNSKSNARRAAKLPRQTHPRTKLLAHSCALR